MRGLVLLLIGLIGIAACSQSTPALPSRSSRSPAQTGSITFAGGARTYVLFQPLSLDPKQLAPLVIALHGYTVDKTWMEGTTHFDTLAEKAGFEVVYPQGTGNSWNAGSCCGNNKNDDVGFIKALIDKLVRTAHIDPKRVYATGMSNGGFMAQRLACELSAQITAVASVSGSLVTESCNPSRAISVLEIHGTEDQTVPFQGGPIAGIGALPPTISLMKRWASLDGCAAAPAVTQSGITTRYVWTPCRDGSSVVLDAIAGGGHSWFGPEAMPGSPDATQTVWDFFSKSPPLP
ncbi:MAG TPA: PHB depolymerase family esterase [Candidatus Dormibacteraeota bacterium]|nr:PHB depolymerase family esterase [Candidatus Dormibacteraeota bacterium]